LGIAAMIAAATAGALALTDAREPRGEVPAVPAQLKSQDIADDAARLAKRIAAVRSEPSSSSQIPLPQTKSLAQSARRSPDSP
jgi:hypothetical protein